MGHCYGYIVQRRSSVVTNVSRVYLCSCEGLIRTSKRSWKASCSIACGTTRRTDHQHFARAGARCEPTVDNAVNTSVQAGDHDNTSHLKGDTPHVNPRSTVSSKGRKEIDAPGPCPPRTRSSGSDATFSTVQRAGSGGTKRRPGSSS